MVARLGGIKQKKSSWGSVMNKTFLLFYSPKPRSHVGGGEREIFPPIPPPPSPILNPSTSPLKSIFDSSQLSGSINFQDDGTTSFLKTIHGSRSKIRLLCRLPSANETFFWRIVTGTLRWLASLNWIMFFLAFDWLRPAVLFFLNWTACLFVKESPIWNYQINR